MKSLSKKQSPSLRKAMTALDNANVGAQKILDYTKNKLEQQSLSLIDRLSISDQLQLIKELDIPIDHRGSGILLSHHEIIFIRNDKNYSATMIFLKGDIDPKYKRRDWYYNDNDYTHFSKRLKKLFDDFNTTSMEGDMRITPINYDADDNRIFWGNGSHCAYSSVSLVKDCKRKLPITIKGSDFLAMEMPANGEAFIDFTFEI